MLPTGGVFFQNLRLYNFHLLSLSLYFSKNGTVRRMAKPFFSIKHKIIGIVFLAQLARRHAERFTEYFTEIVHVLMVDLLRA